MSSDEDEPAPSPSAAVVARRASREAKSMREESGSDEDAEEPEDWEDDGGEASSEEDEKSLIFVNRAARGARDAQLTTLKNTTRRAHGQEAQRPLAPRPRPSYDHGILHGDFAWLNGSKFSRAGWWVAGAQVRSLRL